MSDNSLQPGDFTGLSENYSKFRPTYSASVLRAILALVDKPLGSIDFVDVGAGTGIWTRMVADQGIGSAIAIEPNSDMRDQGSTDSSEFSIGWQKGRGESTGLEDSTVDLLSMASSFHWVDFEEGAREFSRVLRPGGRFVALWNPRLIESNPLLIEIEDELEKIAPTIKRVSSGRSGVTETLTEKLSASPYFDDIVYLEGRHVAKQSREHYLGVWWSVNDIRSQVGEKSFQEFMWYVEDRISGCEFIETTYLTRAWASRRV